jgi:hypothetical protein
MDYSKLLLKRKKENAPKGSRVNAVITIPVVVHVIHNGDLIGDENILTSKYFRKYKS